MMASTLRRCLLRLLAILVVLVMTGVGQHVHAFDQAIGTQTVLTADATGAGDEGGKALTPDAHCAACHLVRGTIPGAAEVREPAILSRAIFMPGADLRPDLAVLDGPARPPRRTPAI